MQLEWKSFWILIFKRGGELKIKLRGIRKQYRKQKHSPIEFVTGRVNR